MRTTSRASNPAAHRRHNLWHCKLGTFTISLLSSKAMYEGAVSRRVQFAFTFQFPILKIHPRDFASISFSWLRWIFRFASPFSPSGGRFIRKKFFNSKAICRWDLSRITSKSAQSCNGIAISRSKSDYRARGNEKACKRRLCFKCLYANVEWGFYQYFLCASHLFMSLDAGTEIYFAFKRHTFRP